MNGTNIHPSQNAIGSRAAKPPPATPAPSAPSVPPPLPNHANPPSTNRAVPPNSNNTTTNGSYPHTQKGKKKNDAPVDPAAMYESLKNRIAALEEEEVLEEEEEKIFGTCIVISRVHTSLMRVLAEEAVKSVKGMEENAIHAKYIELVRYHWYARYVFLNLRNYSSQN
jgi:hypothetical protein